jgi:hypothetical protein
MRTLVFAFLLTGCVATQEPLLRWQAGPPSGRADGKVALKSVPNLRPAGHGEGGLLDVGLEHTAQGTANAVRLDGENNETLDRVVLRLTIDAMRASSLAPTQPEDRTATAHLIVEIHEFWCDAFHSAKATVGLELVLLDPASGAERLRVPIQTTAVGDSCRIAFHEALSHAYQELAHAFSEQEVHTAALGQTSVPPDGT